MLGTLVSVYLSGSRPHITIKTDLACKQKYIGPGRDWVQPEIQRMFPTHLGDLVLAGMHEVQIQRVLGDVNDLFINTSYHR